MEVRLVAAVGVSRHAETRACVCLRRTKVAVHVPQAPERPLGGAAGSVGVEPRMIDTMLIATTNELPGYVVEEVFGEVFGLTVRSRNIGSQLGAGLKSILGGELKGMTKALADSRQQVIDRMVEEAERKGGNAIVAMRFDTSEMGSNWTEICAYGTAVRVRKA